MPVDSVEARKERKARRDTLKNDLPEKLTAEPLKPVSRPLGLRDRPVEKELIKEEVEE
jgi:hypothetical protein